MCVCSAGTGRCALRSRQKRLRRLIFGEREREVQKQPWRDDDDDDDDDDAEERAAFVARLLAFERFFFPFFFAKNTFKIFIL